MEPFVILAIAAVALVVFYIIWANRSQPSGPRTGEMTDTARRERGEPPVPPAG